jgi:hypothetical protein
MVIAAYTVAVQDTAEHAGAGQCLVLSTRAQYLYFSLSRCRACRSSATRLWYSRLDSSRMSGSRPAHQQPSKLQLYVIVGDARVNGIGYLDCAGLALATHTSTFRHLALAATEANQYLNQANCERLYPLNSPKHRAYLTESLCDMDARRCWY